MKNTKVLIQSRFIIGLLTLIVAAGIVKTVFAGDGVPSPKMKKSDMISMPLSADDRLAISELISGYSYNWDLKNTEGVSGLFSPDFTWESFNAGSAKPGESYNAKDKLTAKLKSKFDLLKKSGIQSRLLQTNTIMTLRPDGKVEATTIMLLVYQSPGKLTPVNQESGICKDIIVKTIGGWKFASRSIYLDHK